MGGNRQIAIIGFKGCGKSTAGKLLAAKLGRPFSDTDDILRDIYKEKTGEPLSFREIYVKGGRRNFEDLETEAIKTALGGEGKVISFGGGSLMTMDGKGLDAGRTVFVYLTASPDVLFDRIVANGVPAFFSSNDPRGSFTQLLEKRRPVYEKYATITVDNSYASPEDTVEEMARELLEKGII
jgi:shikimate kinase